MAGHLLFALFWVFLILRNLQTAYVVEKIASAIEKEINKKSRKENLLKMEYHIFKRFFLIRCTL